MKKTLSLFMCLFLIVSMTLTVSALDTRKVIYRTEEVLNNGVIVISEIIDHSQARSTTKNYEHTKTYTRNGTTIAVISICGSFRYYGSSVSVLSKSVTRTDTYNGWSYAQNSFTSSGGTISLSGKLTKLLNSSIAVSMTLNCDASGNISYT